MMGRRPDPDWGQSMRNMGSAGGKHTRGNQGQKPGCLDVIVIGTLITGAVSYGGLNLFT